MAKIQILVQTDQGSSDEFNFEFRNDLELLAFLTGIVTGEITDIESCFGEKHVITETIVKKDKKPKDVPVDVIIMGFDPLTSKED